MKTLNEGSEAAKHLEECTLITLDGNSFKVKSDSIITNDNTIREGEAYFLAGQHDRTGVFIFPVKILDVYAKDDEIIILVRTFVSGKSLAFVKG